MVRHHNPILKVNNLSHIPGIDYGDLPVVPGNIEETFRLIEEGLTSLLEPGLLPVCLGGDHSITLGELRVVAKKYGPVALVHFGSHAGTHDESFVLKYNHGTPFRWAIRKDILNMNHFTSVGMSGSMYRIDEVKDSLDLDLSVITAEEMGQMSIIWAALSRSFRLWCLGRNFLPQICLCRSGLCLSRLNEAACG